ncbi:diacylglycerol kinase family protein [Deminuibacter soli]|uniref:Diacylglycerol kinase family protein n=1 Tax=Deminuibacter soli TaxID=2291815 RepID=A0A3E1NLX2_9BACT|nr:diacylglycerol kinase family protein [Deminuibacter soli]RFM28844.1 diacylglycerol kinase family protein [Deminuibacter soli]
MPSFATNVRHALDGIKVFLATEKNGKIQTVIALLVVAAGCWFHISAAEWCLVLFCMGLVISMEMVNTAIEKLCNHVTPIQHPSIKTIKDISAGAVLFAAIIAAITGSIIFYKYVIALFWPS